MTQFTLNWLSTTLAILTGIGICFLIDRYNESKKKGPRL